MRAGRLAQARARAGFELQRAARAVWGFVVVAGFGVLLAQGWFQDLASTRGRRRAGRGRRLPDRRAGGQGRRPAAHQRAPRARPGARTCPDIELGLLLLTATYVFLAALGGVQLAGLPAGLRAGQLPGHLPPAGGRAAAGAGGHRPGGGDGLRAGRRRPARRSVFPGHAVFIVIFAVLNVAFLHAEVARQRREHRRRLETEVATHARGGPRLPPDLHRPAQRQPGAHPRRGGGEAVAGVDRDHPPAAVRHPGPAAQVAGAADLRAAVAGRRGREAEAQGGGQRRPGAGRGAVPRAHRRVRRHPEGAQAAPAWRRRARSCCPTTRGRSRSTPSWGCRWSRGATVRGILLVDRRVGTTFDPSRARAVRQRRRPGDAHRAVRAGVPGGRALASTSTSASTRRRRR